MKWAIVAWLCALLLVTGCSSLRSSGKAQEFALTPEEEAFSKALAHYAQGLVFESEEDAPPDAVLEAFRKATQLDPGNHRLHSAVALELIQQGDLEGAMAELQRSAKLNPDDVTVHVDLARTAAIADEYDLASESYARAAEISEHDARIYFAHVAMLFQAERDAEAIEVLHQTYSHHPAERITPFVLRWAGLFTHKDSPERAVPCLELAIEHSEKPEILSELYHLLGAVYEEQDNDDAARKAYGVALTHDPTQAASAVRKALLDADADGVGSEQALESLEQALRASPDNISLRVALASILADEQRLADAVPHLTRAYELLRARDSRVITEEFYVFYGGALEQTGEVKDAELILHEGLKAHDDSHVIMNYLSYMWAEKDTRLNEAEDMVVRALKYEPDNAAYLDTLGWVYFKQKRYPEALDHLTRAALLMGRDDPVVLDHVGDALHALNRTAEAIGYWSRSYTLDPEQERVEEKLRGQGVNPADLPKPTTPVQTPADGDTPVPDNAPDAGQMKQHP